MPEQFLHGVEVIQIDNGIRPIRTVNSSTIGIVGTAPDADGFEFQKPILITGPRHAAKLGNAGTLKDAYEAIYQQGVNTVVVIRVPVGSDDIKTLANVAGDVTSQTGVWALMNTQSTIDLTPKILAAPGFTKAIDINKVNPVTSALLSIADRLKSVVISDGPNTTEAAAKLYRKNYGSRRLYLIDPYVTVFDTEAAKDVARPASAYVAGLIAKRDFEKGFWWSPSNQIIRGITGTKRPISHNICSTETEANRLNEADVTTIIRCNGLRLWGNRTTSADPQGAMLCVCRTSDVIEQSIALAHLWAMDRPMSAQLILDIQNGVQAFIDHLVTLGALLGGRVWFDPELNTETTLKAGKLYLDYDFEPPAPLENLIFRAHRNGKYYDDLVSSVVTAS